jgi:hypothetical protein
MVTIFAKGNWQLRFFDEKSLKIPEPFEHFDETWSKDLKLQGLKIRNNELSCKIWFLNKI